MKMDIIRFYLSPTQLHKNTICRKSVDDFPSRQDIRGAFNEFVDFFVQAFKIVVDYEMTDQFLWFQVQINSYSSNWNTPY